VATEEASRYLVGDATHGLKHYVPYRYVTRLAAYGTSFFSDAQRRYVMGAIARGEIVPGVENRSYATQRGWTILYSGTSTRILNPTPGAYYTTDDIGQSRHEARVGWRKVSAIIASNERGMITAADRICQQFIRAQGL
jgi:hypothetical protein